MNFWELNITFSKKVFFNQIWGRKFRISAFGGPETADFGTNPHAPTLRTLFESFNLPGVKFWYSEKKHWPTFGPAESLYVPFVHFLTKNIFLRRLVF